MPENWTCRRGLSLLIPSGPNDKKHLFALLLDPIVVAGHGSRPHVLMACVTSVQNGVPGEDACLLSAGDHPFVTHDSYVDYRFTRLEPADEVQARVAAGLFIEKESCSPELLRRIVSGALRSRRISREFKAILEKVVFG